MGAVWALDDHAEQGHLLGKMLKLEDDSGENFHYEALQDFHVYNLVHCKSIGLDARQAAAFHAIMQQMLDMMQDAGNHLINPTGVGPPTSGSPEDLQLYNSIVQGVTQIDQEIADEPTMDDAKKLQLKKRKDVLLAKLPKSCQQVKINPQDATNPNDCFKQFEQMMRDHSVGPNSIFLGSQAKILTDFTSMTLFKHYLLYQYLLYHKRETEVLRFEMNYEQPLPPPDLSAARLVRPDRRLKRGLGSTAGGGYGATGGMASSKGMDANVSPRYAAPAETPEVRDLTERRRLKS